MDVGTNSPTGVSVVDIAEEAARSFGPAWCARELECLPSIYALAYPKDAEAGNGTTTQCVDELVQRLGDDKSKTGA